MVPFQGTIAAIFGALVQSIYFYMCLLPGTTQQYATTQDNTTQYNTTQCNTTHYISIRYQSMHTDITHKHNHIRQPQSILLSNIHAPCTIPCLCH